MEGTKKFRSIKWLLLQLTLIPIVAVSLVIGCIAIFSMEAGMEDEALSSLQNTCEAVRAGYMAFNDEPYSLNQDGDMVKGDLNITKDEELIDSWSGTSDVDVTLCYGDTRKATSLCDVDTGERIVGTQVSEEVVKQVLEGGQEIALKGITVNKQSYYAYYVPLYNPDGSTVGMVFAGMPSKDVDSYIKQRAYTIAGISIAILLAVCVVCMVIVTRVVKFMVMAKEAVQELGEGNLTFRIDPAVLQRRDELGEIAREVHGLGNRLREIVGDIQKSAELVLSSGDELVHVTSNTSHNANDISAAVEDISKGAVSQAEEIETATGNVNDMGRLIEDIVDNIGRLDETSKVMQQSENASSEIMEQLFESNDKTVEAIHKISANISATDESVKQIEDAVSLISNLASQTNLLSLNASIEAARAGEAGKGFAVVATEIQQLAEQSDNAAKQISEIIEVLAQNSRNSLDKMDEVNERLQDQQTKFQETKEQFQGVSEGIDASRDGTDKINGQAQECNVARTSVIDVIQSLSAISQENAASAQETSASMQELNDSMSVLVESAGKLKELAESLQQDVAYFKM